MKTVKIYHCIQHSAIVGCNIEIVEPLPDLGNSMNWEKESVRRFEQQAQELMDALLKHLPGGTLDHLVAKLLIHKASHFVVSHKALD